MTKPVWICLSVTWCVNLQLPWLILELVPAEWSLPVAFPALSRVLGWAPQLRARGPLPCLLFLRAWLLQGQPILVPYLWPAKILAWISLLFVLPLYTLSLSFYRSCFGCSLWWRVGLPAIFRCPVDRPSGPGLSAELGTLLILQAGQQMGGLVTCCSLHLFSVCRIAEAQPVSGSGCPSPPWPAQGVAAHTGLTLLGFHFGGRCFYKNYSR